MAENQPNPLRSEMLAELPDPNEIAEAFAAAVRQRLGECVVPTPAEDTLPLADPIPPGTPYYLAATGKIMPPGTEPAFPARKKVYACSSKFVIGGKQCPSSINYLHITGCTASVDLTVDNYGNVLASNSGNRCYIIRSMAPLPPIDQAIAYQFNVKIWAPGADPRACNPGCAGGSNSSHVECANYSANVGAPRLTDLSIMEHLAIAAAAINAQLSPIENYLRALTRFGQPAECGAVKPLSNEAQQGAAAFAEVIARAQARDTILAQMRKTSAALLNENASLHERLRAQQQEQGMLKQALEESARSLKTLEITHSMCVGAPPQADGDGEPADPFRKELAELRALVGSELHLDVEVGRARINRLESALADQQKTYADLVQKHTDLNRTVQTALNQAATAQREKEQIAGAAARHKADQAAQIEALKTECAALRAQLLGAIELPAGGRDDTIIALQKRAEDADARCGGMSAELDKAKAELQKLQAKFATLRSLTT